MRQTIFGIVIALLAVIFALQNSLQQNLKIYFWEVNMPLSLLLVVTLILGLIAGMLIMAKPFLEKSNEIKELKRQIASTPKSVSASGGAVKS